MSKIPIRPAPTATATATVKPTKSAAPMPAPAVKLTAAQLLAEIAVETKAPVPVKKAIVRPASAAVKKTVTNTNPAAAAAVPPSPKAATAAKKASAAPVTATTVKSKPTAKSTATATTTPSGPAAAALASTPAAAAPAAALVRPQSARTPVTKPVTTVVAAKTTVTPAKPKVNTAAASAVKAPTKTATTPTATAIATAAAAKTKSAAVKKPAVAAPAAATKTTTTTATAPVPVPAVPHTVSEPIVSDQTVQPTTVITAPTPTPAPAPAPAATPAVVAETLTTTAPNPDPITVDSINTATTTAQAPVVVVDNNSTVTAIIPETIQSTVNTNSNSNPIQTSNINNSGLDSISESTVTSVTSTAPISTPKVVRPVKSIHSRQLTIDQGPNAKTAPNFTSTAELVKSQQKSRAAAAESADPNRIKSPQDAAALDRIRKKWAKEKLKADCGEVFDWLQSTTGFNLADYISIDKRRQSIDNKSHFEHGEDAIDLQLFDGLQTGVLLCQLANTCDTELKLRYTTKGANPGTFFARDNISKFLSACIKWGLKSSCLYETDDLVMRKNDRNVVNGLLDIARHVHIKFGVEPPQLVKFELEIAELEKQAAAAAEAEAVNNSITEIKTEPEPVPAVAPVVAEPVAEPQIEPQPEPEPEPVPVAEPVPESEPEESDEESDDGIAPKRGPRWLPYHPVINDKLDEAVAELVNGYDLDIYIKRLIPGQYHIGDEKVCYLRLVRRLVLVRVGGGWDCFVPVVVRKMGVIEDS